MTEASGTLMTPYGELRSAWTLDGDAFHWEVTVPPNTTATAYLPSGASDAAVDGEAVESAVVALPAGSHRLTARVG